MPRNPKGKYRDYSEADIERIWTIRLLQGIGYTLSEIEKIIDDENINLETSLAEKIKELETKKAELEKHLGYAKKIKLVGRFPSRPKDMENITFDDFYEKAVNEWNINNDPNEKRYKELVDLVLNKPEEEWKDTDFGKMIEFIQGIQEEWKNKDIIMIENIIPLEIMKRKDKGPSDPEVQLLVKIIYESVINNQNLKELSVNEFAREAASKYVYGDIAHIIEREYGKEACAFMADAIAVFGGYSCYADMEK